MGIIIDQNKCKRDGICVQICPMGIIEQKDNSFPSPADGAESLCIECGHCVAACPHGALSLKDMPSGKCPPLRNEWMLNPEQAEHFLRSRRSMRAYKDKPVDKETIIRLIEIARHAPSGHNSQPVEWLIIYNSAEVKKLAGLVIDWMEFIIKENPEMATSMNFAHVVERWHKGNDSILRNAPHLIVAHAPKANRLASAASTIALAYLDLAAPSFGLGTCWAGFFLAAALSWTPLQKALSLPEGHICFGAMMIGYAAAGYYRFPLRKEPQISWR